LPSPVGHALAGLAVHLASARDRWEAWDVATASVIVGAALAPDLDLVLKLVDGENHHQGGTHSLFAACVAAAIVYVAARVRGMERSGRLAILAGLGWLTHLVLDYLGRDTHPPIGLPLLWPFAEGYFKCPRPVFLDIGRTLDVTTVVHDLVAVAWELIVLSPIPALIYRRRLRDS
jgi:membrane-bound metal-dependent hydrolase YbcI (DUF457 family)